MCRTQKRPPPRVFWNEESIDHVFCHFAPEWFVLFLFQAFPHHGGFRKK